MRRSIPPNAVAAIPWSRTAFRTWTMAATSRPPSALEDSAGLALQVEFAHDPIAAGLLGQIEGAVTAIDQIRHRLAVLELSDPDRNRDLRENLSGRAAGELTVRDRPA